ncbi:MAG: DKNYY domain-containing protein [Burkholderiaceae bacterium]
MSFRPPLTLSLLLALAGLAACDGGSYHRVDAQWAHGDFRFAPQDTASFQPLGDRFAHDARRGYCDGAEIAGSDGASFTVVADHEARDRYHVYHCDTYRKGQEYWTVSHLRITRIEGADPATYVSLGHGYARDQRRVYAEGTAFTVRDAASFEPLEGGYARDPQRGYHALVELRGSHGPSFRVLGRGYAADAKHVWHLGEPVAGADPASFVADESREGPADANDKSGAWHAGRRVVAAQ